jgi:chromosome segregation ATPase
VIDSAEAMRAGKKSALEEQQEALRKDIERLSGDLRAVADSVVDIKAIVSQDFRNLLRYPGAMQDLEARFDFVTSVLEGLEAQGVSSPRLETQQAGMVVATQRAERVKHERRVRTLELKRDWWKRVLASPGSEGKAKAEATRGLKETEDAIAAEKADYRARTADTPGDLLRNSAGMRNARAAEAFIREQRQQLNTAYEQLTNRVRQIQQLTVPANRAEERGQLTRTAGVPAGTPAAPDTGATPDYADMQRKRGLLVALSAIDLKEQAKLDAAIDAAARKTEEARAEYHRTPGNAMHPKGTRYPRCY